MIMGHGNVGKGSERKDWVPIEFAIEPGIDSKERSQRLIVRPERTTIRAS